MALPDHRYLNTAEALQKFCDVINTRQHLIIDTEFLRERTYWPQLCLIQLKSDEHLACVDAIAIKDLSPLLAVMDNPAITKVFHAASQDLEIFYYQFNRLPTPLFDTQIAAPLLGHNDQIGYANLVKGMLDLELDKSQTRADWTQRPLSEKQLSYALDDVIYLEQLYKLMSEQLLALNRLEWLAPEFEAQSDPHKYQQNAGDRWLRIKQIHRYKGGTLAIIQALANWREIKAREKDLPRNWIIKDDAICTLAQQKPVNEDELSRIRTLERKTQDRYGKEILQIVSEAKDVTPMPLPESKKKKKLGAASQAQIQLLNAWAHHKAHELNIATSILAPQKLLEQSVIESPSDALAGWRTPLLVEDFTALLNGNATLQATDNGLKLKQKT
ncbi:MAG: ribonuclease D [Granulosicoccaceae bacterium]